MDHPARPLVSLGIAALVALVAVGASGFSDEAENYRRLRAMPVERRVDLAENLERFDRLDPKDQAAIRALDAALARKDPVDQAKYRAILRRYHLWANGLNEDQKKKLEAAAGPAERFEIARKLRLADRDGSKKGPRVSGIRTGDYGLDNPTEAAFLLKIWEKLEPAQQAEIARRSPRQVRDNLRKHAADTKIHRDWLTLAEEATFLARLEADRDFREFVRPMVKKAADAAQKDADAALKKGDVSEKKANHLKNAERPYAAFLYFEDHPARAIPPQQLDRFVASLPPWFLGMLDPLSADDARNYLTVVYRQLYPHPAEMPEPSKAKPTPKPAPKKAGPPTPS